MRAMRVCLATSCRVRSRFRPASQCLITRHSVKAEGHDDWLHRDTRFGSHIADIATPHFKGPNADITEACPEQPESALAGHSLP